MFSFCPHCGQTIGQEQVEGRMLVCADCGKTIGMVVASAKKVVMDQTEELIRQSSVARCPQCQQVVQVKVAGAATRSFVPHYDTGPKPRMCKNSGKPADVEPAKVPPQTSAAQKPATSKDLSGYYTRESVKVIACPRQGSAAIEELTLAYLDKTDRVRIQIEALREVLGADFRMKSYPTSLKRPDLGLWGNANRCVIAKKHPQGGIQPLTDSEMRSVLEDVERNREVFFQG